MGANTDALKQGYEAYGRGDLDAAMENWSDDIRWENPEAPQLPNPGVIEGKDNVRNALMEIPNYWETFTVTPDEFIEQGDTVVVLGHSEGKAKETGKETKVPFVHVWRFGDGKVNEVLLLTDTALVADALDRL
jgi:ketosteroid isomerase-like protein